MSIITIDWAIALSGLLVAFMVDLDSLDKFIKEDKEKLSLKERLRRWFAAYDIRTALRRYGVGLLPAIGGVVGQVIGELVKVLA